MAAQKQDISADTVEEVLNEVSKYYEDAAVEDETVDNVLDAVSQHYDDDEHKNGMGTRARQEFVVRRHRNSLHETIKYPLTTKQRSALVGDSETAKYLMSDLTEKISPCTIAVCGRAGEEVLQLVIAVSAKQSQRNQTKIEYRKKQNRVNAIEQLEMKLGVLLSDDRIAQIRKGSADESDGEYLDRMKSVLSDGVACTYSNKKNQSVKVFVTVDEPSPNHDQRNCYRLYWKEHQEDANEEKESCHLSKIEQVQIGKGRYSFSVVTEKEKRDFLCPSVEIVAYLSAVCRHFKVSRDRRGY